MVDLLIRYIECVKAGDASGFAALFTENGEFEDEAPVKLGMHPIKIQGRKNIEEFFRKLFRGGGFEITNVAINGNAMRYDLKHRDSIVLALGVAEEENKLIKKYRVIGV